MEKQGSETAPVAPEQAAVQAAELAVARARQAEQQFAAERERLEARLAALEGRQSTAVSPEAVAEVQRAAARERNTRRLQAARDMGIDDRTPDGRVRLTDEQILGLMPDVDPSDAEGRARLGEWQRANPGLFRRRGPSLESITAEVMEGFRDTPPHPLFNLNKLTKSVFHK